jgi:hypothetical protein
MVLKLLQNLKTDKSPEPDSLHPRLLFEIKESLTEPWSIIFNQLDPLAHIEFQLVSFVVIPQEVHL